MPNRAEGRGFNPEDSKKDEDKTPKLRLIKVIKKQPEAQQEESKKKLNIGLDDMEVVENNDLQLNLKKDELPKQSLNEYKQSWKGIVAQKLGADKFAEYKKFQEKNREDDENK
jgi:hypothetical protein